MKILILTQNDYLYINRFVRQLITELLVDENKVTVMTFSASPFGKKMTFYKKVVNTIDIFGLNFFLRYSVLFFIRRFTTPGVEKICKEIGIDYDEIYGSINSKSNVSNITRENYDLIVSLSGNQIFKKPLIEASNFGCINLHCSPLPKYRGLMPSFWVLAKGETKTAATVFLVDEGIDSGPIILQEFVDIQGLTQKEVILITKQIGCELIVKATKLFKSGEVKLTKNSNDFSSYYGFPNRDDVKKFIRSGGKFF